jgi:7-keto-8-aminopelargonate synthetase-like enzyme
MSKKLYEEGINVMPIVYPAVKEDESRLRFFVSSMHADEDLIQTVEIMHKIINDK